MAAATVGPELIETATTGQHGGASGPSTGAPPQEFWWENERDFRNLLCSRRWYRRKRNNYVGGEELEFERDGENVISDKNNIIGTYRIQWREHLSRICVEIQALYKTTYFASRRDGTVSPMDWCPDGEIVLCTRDSHFTDSTLSTFSAPRPIPEAGLRILEWCREICQAGILSADDGDKKAVRRAFARLDHQEPHFHLPFQSILEKHAQVYAWGQAGRIGRPSRYNDESAAIINALRSGQDWKAACKRAAMQWR